MKKTKMVVFSLAVTLFSFSSSAGADGPRCFDEKDNQPKYTMIDRTDGMTGVVKQYKVASSAVNHFTSCLTMVVAGAASGTVLDLCGCEEVAKDLCGGTSPDDWKDSAMGLSKCATIFKG